MHAPAPQTVFLSDYKAPGWRVESVHLTFRLAPDATRVISRIVFQPNADAPAQPFTLHGEELTLIAASIDGIPITPRCQRQV